MITGGFIGLNLLLDQDAAARTANMARIYNDLGFNRLALKEAWNSIGHNYTNYSAHRFLADSYVGQARFRAARASELLQAQIMQPINTIPVQPQLTNDNIAILNTTGPSSLSTNEYDPLFTSNGIHVFLNGAVGSRNTKSDNAVLSGIYDNLSMSLGQFHFQTDGFRTNDDYQQDIYNAFGQYAVNSDLNIQAELKSEDIYSGDTALRINGKSESVKNLTQNRRKIIEQDSARLGGHYKIDEKQDILLSSIYTTLKDNETNKNKDPTELDGNIWQFIEINSLHKAVQSEFQYQLHPGTFAILAGAGYTNLSINSFDKTNAVYINSTPPCPKEIFYLKNDKCHIFLKDESYNNHSLEKREYFNGYLYMDLNINKLLVGTFGVSFDSLANNVQNKMKVNPKFGVRWQPAENLLLRGAVFKTLKRPLVTQQTLEPTQVAGFNQIYDSENDTSAWNYGIGIDYQIRNTIFFGGQLIYRQTTFPVTVDNLDLFQDRNEASYLAYSYWTPSNWLSLSAEYHFDEFHRDFNSAVGDDTDPRSLATHWVPLSLNFYFPSGLFNRITANHIDQHVTFVQDNLPLDGHSASFWTFDLVLGYRLPKKYGSVSLEVRNLFDNAFDYQSTFDASGPQLTPVIPERQFFCKLNLTY